MCVCVFSHACSYQGSDWSILLEATVNGSSGLCLSHLFLTYFLRVSGHSSSFIVLFSLAFIYLSILVPPNSTQSLHPFTAFTVLFTFLLTSTPNPPHLPFVQSASKFAKLRQLTALWLYLLTVYLSFSVVTPN